ncbi:MAG: M28 family peptidase [Planctomycetota bacterium]
MSAAEPTAAATRSAGPAGRAVGVLIENPLNADRAMGYLERVCAIGPRPSASEGMRRQIALLRKHFEGLGGQVRTQSFLAPNPLGGAKVRMTNLIVRYRPELQRRVLLCAHYDTRPLPDRDPDPVKRRRGVFVGANDGASGVALLMELAHHMPILSGDVGVDLVMFDGEEYVFRENRDRYFLGSQWFAMQYKKRRAGYRYEWGVLLDMVGDADLRLLQERLSWTWRDTRPLVRDIWATAARLGVREFDPRVMKTPVRDDHVALRQFGKIPCIDIIDFTYPHWHTEADTPDKCSGESLAKVGWVVLEWLRALDAEGVQGLDAEGVQGRDAEGVQGLNAQSARQPRAEGAQRPDAGGQP